MIDVSNFTIDTPVLIKIMTPVGMEIPELKSKVPIESYASIEQVISIMNRGIDIDFPKESNEHEISKKIEDIMIEYNAKAEIARDKGYFVEHNIDTALDTIQEKNNTSLTEKEIEEEFESHIFEYGDVLKRIYIDLQGSELDHIFDTDDYKRGVDRLKEAEKERKSRDRIREWRKQLLKEKADYDKVSVGFYKQLIRKDEEFYTDNEELLLDGSINMFKTKFKAPKE